MPASCSPSYLNPSTLSYHLASSNFDANSDPKTSLTLASASSLLSPSPTFSSYIYGPTGPLVGPDFGAAV
jgi:hypothetical protein